MLHVAEHSEVDSLWPYMIRDDAGRAIAKVMNAEEAKRLVNAVNLVEDGSLDDMDRLMATYP